MRMPMAKPTRPTIAFRSPPPMRMTMRSGQPRNTSAPIITNTAMTKRVIGEEPPTGRNSLRTSESANAPSTRPMISGRMYCTMPVPVSAVSPAVWNLSAPAMSRRKQAMQKPMFCGLPYAVSSTAAAPTIRPVSTISPYRLKNVSFFSIKDDLPKRCVRMPPSCGIITQASVIRKGV